MIDPQLKQQVIDKVKECKQIALDRLKLDLGPIKISFDLKGSRAGTANSTLNILRLNEDYLIKHPLEMINETIPHEMSHLIANAQYKRQCHHDFKWQYIMAHLFQLIPNRTHSFGPSATSKNTKKHAIVCGNCNETLRITTKLANKIVQSGRIQDWKCGKCEKIFPPNTKIILDNT